MLQKLKEAYTGSETSGFTMYELVVLLAIVTAVSAVVLIGFAGLKEGVGLNQSARGIALSFRSVQNASFAVSGVTTKTGYIIPDALGIQFDLSYHYSYFIFADLDNNGTYTSAVDVILKGRNFLNFPNRITMQKFEYCTPGIQNSCPALINIIFAAPEATMTITDKDGASIGDQVDIRLRQPSGTDTKVISIRTSGQISIR